MISYFKILKYPSQANRNFLKFSNKTILAILCNFFKKVVKYLIQFCLKI